LRSNLGFILLVFFYFEATAQESGIAENQTVSFSLHKDNYFILYSKLNQHEEIYDANDDEEVQFQLSFKLDLVQFSKGKVVVAYTQKSFFQVFDDDNSRPFRETNYNPEVFYRLGDNFNFIDLGYEHESNGMEDPKSRSWDKVYLKFQFVSKNFKLSYKTWSEIEGEEYDPEFEERKRPMQDYYGTNELEIGVLIKGVILKSLIRRNFYTTYGYSENRILWHLNKNHYWGLIYTKGYGHSLREYHLNTETYGLVIQLNI